MTDHTETETETSDPDFGPEAYKNHSASCVCPDCGERAFEQYRDPSVDGCSHFHDPKTCPQCASDERELRFTRLTAAKAVTAAEEAMAALRHLAMLLVDLNADGLYQEFYSDTTADEDALADIGDAQRSLRSFARIARERAARTERQP